MSRVRKELHKAQNVESTKGTAVADVELSKYKRGVACSQEPGACEVISKSLGSQGSLMRPRPVGNNVEEVSSCERGSFCHA